MAAVMLRSYCVSHRALDRTLSSFPILQLSIDSEKLRRPGSQVQWCGCLEVWVWTESPGALIAPTRGPRLLIPTAAPASCLTLM